MQFTTLKQAAFKVVALGKGALLAKMDLHSVYRKVPVHWADQPLLGFRLGGKICKDCALPFDLHLAPKVFTAVADSLS